MVVPLLQKRASTGCTQTTGVVPAEPEIPWRLPPKYYSGPQLLNFSVKMGTGVSNILTLLAKKCCECNNLNVNVNHRHHIKNSLINGAYCLPCLSC